MDEQEKLELLDLKQWDYNHEKVLQAWEEIYNESHGKRPTQTEIAKRTGLRRQTVASHLKRATFDVDIAPNHIMNITPMLDEFYTLIHDPDITPYAKGKLILDYIKLIGNPTEKKEVKQLEATKLFIEIADSKTKSKMDNIFNTDDAVINNNNESK